jgi:hypothetical protein
MSRSRLLDVRVLFGKMAVIVPEDPLELADEFFVEE